MWVEFVVGSHSCSEGFSPGTPVFLPPQKPTFLNSNLNLETADKKSHYVDFHMDLKFRQANLRGSESLQLHS